MRFARGGLAVMIVWLFARMSFAEAEAAARAVFLLEINGSRVGDVIVLLKNEDVLVPMEALRRGGIVGLVSATEDHGGVAYASLARSEPRLTYSLDDKTLTLAVVAPPRALGSSTIDLTSRAPKGLWYSRDTSAYLTYAPSLVDFSTFRGYAEAGVVVGSGRATTSASYTATAPARLLSQVVLDDRPNVRQLLAGDSFAATGALGGAVLLGGLTFTRAFELDPYLVRVPRLAYGGSVIAPSTVDVYVNDVLVRRVPVSPGEFQLTGITPMAGAGSVRYVIRDPMGQESRVESRYYAASRALGKGVDEFVYAAGFLRERYGIDNFNYGSPALLARHRLGLTNLLTVGGRAEASFTRLSFGTELTLATRAGQVDLESSASVDRDGPVRRGSAGLAAYTYQGGLVAVRTSVKATSAYYSTASLSPEEDRALVEQATSTTIALSRRASVSCQISFGLLRNGGQTARWLGAFNAQLLRELSLQVGGIRNDTSLHQRTYEVFATLNIALPANHVATLTERVYQEGPETTASISRPLGGTNGLSYQASTAQGAHDRYSANVMAQTSMIRASATYSNLDGQSSGIVDAAGTVVWMPNAGIFFTRPVNQSFAVVEIPKGKNIPVYLNHHEVGRTDDAGQLFLPDLMPYYANHIHVDGAELGADAEFEGDEIAVAPPLRGGAHVVFWLRRLRAVRGRIVSADPAVSVRYGQLDVAANERRFTSPIGAGGEFELESVPVGQWPARVESPETSCEFQLVVPSQARSIRDVGEFQCVQRADAREEAPP